MGRLLLEALKSVADDLPKAATFIWILHIITENPEPSIRMESLDSIPHAAMLCHSEREKLLFILDHLLQFVAKLLKDTEPDVRKAAQLSLLVLMDQSLVGQSSVEHHVCPTVNELCSPKYNPVNAVQLMCKMAPFLGREATERCFLKTFCDLCRSTNMEVRKVCASFFGEICAIVGQTTTERILLCYFVDLCQDPFPTVRMTCTEVIPSISCACSLQRRKAVLAPIFVSLLCDSVRWIRVLAFKTLGPFISTFAVPRVAEVAYNENGELVLVNREGCEFRLNPNTDRCDSDMDDDSYCDEREDKKATGNLSLSSLHGENNFQISKAPSEEEKADSLKSGDFDDYVSHLDVSMSCVSNKPALEEEYGSEASDHVHLENGEVEEINTSGSVNELKDDVSCKQSPMCSSQSGMDCTEGFPKYSTGFDMQETDLDDPSHNQDNKSENSRGTGDCSTATPLFLPSDEWDFNSFQYWRIPIPDIPNVDELANTELTNLSLKNFCDNSVIVNEELPGSAQKSEIVMQHSQSGEGHPPSAHGQDIVPQDLVEFFVSMTNPPNAQMTDVRYEIALYCAFSLPAVALTLGKENWGSLRRTYEALAADMQWKVRKTVACSIHEMAEILGEELTAKDLLPIYTGLIKDLDEVRIGALKHLADFIKLLPPAERKSFLSQFEMFLVTDNCWNWRFREELAHQLSLLYHLYTPEENCNHIVPIAIELLRDKVAAVRTIALKLVTALINHITSEGPLLRKLLPQLAQEFANSTRWERRQSFALLCSNLVSARVLGGDQFAREVLPYLLDLSYDRVPNVRLAVAKTLASDIMAQKFFNRAQSPHRDVLMQVLKRLSNDNDRDVRYFASNQAPHQLTSNSSQMEEMPSC